MNRGASASSHNSAANPIRRKRSGASFADADGKGRWAIIIATAVIPEARRITNDRTTGNDTAGAWRTLWPGGARGSLRSGFTLRPGGAGLPLLSRIPPRPRWSHRPRRPRRPCRSGKGTIWAERHSRSRRVQRRLLRPLLLLLGRFGPVALLLLLLPAFVTLGRCRQLAKSQAGQYRQPGRSERAEQVPSSSAAIRQL